MGRKVNPIGFRLGVNRDWDSKWFAEGREYSRFVVEDAQIRELIQESLGRSGLSRIEIERLPKRLVVRLYTAKPGMVIGRKGSNINALKARLEMLTEVTGRDLRLDVVEVEQPDCDAKVVAENVAEQIERRVSYRRAMRQVIRRAMQSGAEGIKVSCSGRLSGSDMSRCEWLREGRVPLHTLRANLDFARDEAITPYGRIGIKVWIYRGDVMLETH